ncbi:MAG: Holliday junction branch migration DNA helicase RuvB, partial [Actinobacteria bacterium]|nr:Holliday junction branch migration DNA helicase RuvB [Actinomycetota bacterium]
MLSGKIDAEEAAFEAGLRPRRMDEFVGQADLKERLAILVEAARGRGEPLDHVLFSGPPGLGKTTLAGILSNEMDAQFRATSGPALERAGDLAAILSNLDPGDVLFIDEIHRLPRVVEEVLYTAMEDFQLDIVVGKGPAARSIRLELPPFALMGATTRVGRVTPPLRDRFGYVARIDYYPPDDLELIVRRSASILDVDADDAGTRLIAERSRGTPRIANRLLRRVRDYAAVRADGLVTGPIAEKALAVFEVDDRGLDAVDRAILEAVV